jgi:nucleotide-binding universal stress UspA family protein
VASIREMNELLVPLDGSRGSERSLPVAGRLADRLGLGLRLFTAGESEAMLKEAAARLLPDREVAFEVAAEGDPVDAIVAAAGDGRVVCMATAGSLLPHGGHVGSVAEGVVRELGRPVFLVGPQMEPDPGESTQRVIAPVDGSRSSEAALRIAGDVASALQVPLWIVTNIDPKTEAKARGAIAGDLVAAESGYVHRLATATARQFDIEVEYDVLHQKDPARAIVDFTGDDGTIVMSTHGRSGLNRLFGGSVATDVVAHSKRAVLVWRPDEE